MEFHSGCYRCFSALSTNTRVEIVQLLQKNKTMSVLEIAKYFQLSQPTITHHLSYLKKSGILKSKKEGRKVYYYIKTLCQNDKCSIFS